MTAEGQGQMETAFKLFQQAWDEATADFEKFTSAHYVARQQKNEADKIKVGQNLLAICIKTK